MRSSILKLLSATSILCAIQFGCKPTTTDQTQDHDDYDLVVYGATPGGVACAVRSAREGLDVLLVTYSNRIGGMLTSGLGVWDTLYEGYRAPIYNELRQSIFDYYRETYGEDSEVYKTALPGKTGHNNGTFEAHVAERLITELLTNESNIAVLYNHYPTSAKVHQKEMQSVTFTEMDGSNTKTFSAPHFADCSYEGDLMAVAGVSYRVGRESKDEFSEPLAGVIYMLPVKERIEPNSRKAQIFDRLNIRHFGTDQVVIYPDSTHESDTNVQAYNMRYYITNDPNNQIDISPSDNYDPDYLRTLEFQTPGNVVKPNNKLGVNRPQLVGLHQKYVEGNWATRKEIVDEHIRVTRDMVYYVKHDPSAPERMRELWKDWGLAKDEYVDNDNNPYDIYVREARRLTGPYVYSQNDLSLEKDYDRAPLHSDSIGIVEWYMDAHACTWRKSPQGGLHEGKMMPHKETFVGQLPYRTLLAQEVNNLIVPVCLSSTHVAWGAIRLEPTWMQVGESAAYAILQARDQKVTLPKIDIHQLQRTLVKKRSLITFFNDFYIDDDDSWIPAVQYFGTQGFFHEYDAHTNQAVSKQTLSLWINAVKDIREGHHKGLNLVRSIAKENQSDPANYTDFISLLNQANLTIPNHLASADKSESVTRGVACEILFQLL